MSDGHARTAGKLTRSITVGGKTYRLAPVQQGMYAELEAYVAESRANPMALAVEACKTAPAEQHDTIWRAAMREASRARVVTAEEIGEFEASVRGLAWKLWACLQKHHAEEFPEPADALRLVEQAEAEKRLEELATEVHTASGEEDLGN
jgi:hypothetical protein